jgi:TonB family protein
MLRPKPTISAATPQRVIGVSVLFLLLAVIFAFLNSQKLKSLRADVANAHRRVIQESDLKSRETAVAEREAKISEVENKAAKTGAELAQLRKEKTELQTKLEANQNQIVSEIASLKTRIEGGTAAKPSENRGAALTTEQQLTAPPPSLEIKAGPVSTPTPEQPTSPSPSPEIKPEPVEETTAPRQRPKQQKTASTKTPQVAGPPGTMSISSAKALATYAPPPEYPREPRSKGIAGSGVCVVSVDPLSGSVTEASMAQSTGNPILDKSAVSTFRKWRFKPGTVSKVKIPVEFTLGATATQY